MRRTSRRFGQVLATGLAAVLGSGGCGGGAPAEPVDPPATGTPPAVEFTAGIEVRGQALHITYRLANSSGEDLIVLNRVPAYTAGGAETQDANAVYVTGEPEGRVQIAKRAFAMPDTDHKTWTQAARISGVTVEPGRSVGEELTVPLPLRRHHPYGDDLGDGPIALPDPVTEVVFCVGVLRKAEARLPSGDGAATATLPHLSSTTGVQHLSCSSPVRL